MGKRLQVVVDDAELRRFRRAAKQAGMTLSEWVRQTLRRAERSLSTGDVERKLAAIRRAASFSDAPAPDIEQMLAEIEKGYEQDLPGLD